MPNQFPPFVIPALPVIPPALVHANASGESMRQGFISLCATVKQTWARTWGSGDAGPQQIFDELGTGGVRFMQISGATIEYLQAVADFMGIPLTEELPVEFHTAPYNWTPNPDGTVTVGEPK